MDKKFTVVATILAGGVSLLTICTFLWNIAVGMTNLQHKLNVLSERSEYTIGVLDGRTDVINDLQLALKEVQDSNMDTLDVVQKLSSKMLQHKFTNHNHIVLKDPDGVTVKIPMERIKI